MITAGAPALGLGGGQQLKGQSQHVCFRLTALMDLNSVERTAGRCCIEEVTIKICFSVFSSFKGAWSLWLRLVCCYGRWLLGRPHGGVPPGKREPFETNGLRSGFRGMKKPLVHMEWNCNKGSICIRSTASQTGQIVVGSQSGERVKFVCALSMDGLLCFWYGISLMCCLRQSEFGFAIWGRFGRKA